MNTTMERDDVLGTYATQRLGKQVWVTGGPDQHVKGHWIELHLGEPAGPPHIVVADILMDDDRDQIRKDAGATLADGLNGAGFDARSAWSTPYREMVDRLVSQLAADART